MSEPSSPPELHAASCCMAGGLELMLCLFISSWQEATEQYLIPLLTNGPNNQVRGLKWALALSKALGR